MTEEISAPLVPAEVDLRGYNFMPLFGDHLFGSETWISASFEGKVAALRLWWRAYAKEVPSGSLPDDDALLADYAGYGVAVKSWLKIKSQGIRGWKKCTKDGRLYHAFLAEKVLEAWEARVKASAKGMAGAKKRWGKVIPQASLENSTGTPQAMPGDSKLTEREREREREKEPPLPSGAPPLAASLEENPGSEKSETKRKTQIPEDWELDSSGMKFALEQGFSLLEAELMANQFRDHHWARGNVFASIPAAWRTWVRNEKKFGGKINGNGGSLNHEPEDKIRRRIAFYEDKRREALRDFDQARADEFLAIINADREKLSAAPSANSASGGQK